MGIKVNVQWKFKVNGKEYTSVEEMPANLREAYERAKGTSRMAGAKVIFNGREYENVEAMPPDVRLVFDKIIEGAQTGKIPPEALAGATIQTRPQVQYRVGISRSHDTPRPVEPESILSLSPRMLIVGGALLILLIALYYLMAR